MSYRRAVTQGISMIKWVEALLIAGGLAAILLPFIGCYVAWIQIRR